MIYLPFDPVKAANGLAKACLIAGAVIALVIVFLIQVGFPWVWSWLKPWLHALTA